MRRAALLVALGLLAACRGFSEVVVVVDNVDLVVPDQLQRLRVRVSNPGLGGALRYESQEVLLCGATPTAGCKQLPVSVALTPGAADPDALVRVQVDAFAAGASEPSISNASVFTFRPGERQRLELPLFQRCAGQLCASSDQACRASGSCDNVAPTAVDPTPPAGPDGSAGGGGPIQRITALPGRRDALAGGYQILPAPGTEPGDLIVLALGNVDTTTPPGWTSHGVVALSGGRTIGLYTRFAAADELERLADYRFVPQDSNDVTYVLVVYRGVSRAASRASSWSRSRRSTARPRCSSSSSRWSTARIRPRSASRRRGTRPRTAAPPRRRRTTRTPRTSGT
jgi:hypothetical protein